MDIGTQVGSYRIDGLLGRGGMAEVYKAWHLNLHRYEALKALPPQMTFDHSFVERFLQEARTAAQLHHPNIATIHAVSDDAGPQFYFAMELVEGGDLAGLLAQRGALPLDESLSILRQAARALDYAHARGVVHRDVKPGNILLGSNDDSICVKMVDFGIARAQAGEGSTRLTRTGMIVGTPEYMSPEQAGSGAPVDHRSDLYSLGIVAYEMLCGQPPFRAQRDTSPMSVLMAHVRDLPRPPIEINSALPHAANNAILKALAKDPRERFHSCADFVDALSGAFTAPLPDMPQHSDESMPAGGWMMGVPAPTPPKASFRIVPLLVGLSVLAGLGLVFFGMHNMGVPGSSGASSSTNNNPVTISSTNSSSVTTASSSISLQSSDSKPDIKAPDMIGVSEDQAKALADGKGLKVEVITGHSDRAPAGRVISQSPDSGTSMKKGDTVTVRVSTGPDNAPVSTGPDVVPQLKSFVEDWRQSWQSHDLTSFMSRYADPVRVDGKWESRDQYEVYNQHENSKQPTMQVEISNVEVSPASSGDEDITFEQHFKGWGQDPSDNYESWGHVHLTVHRENGEWKITEEHFTRTSSNKF